MDTNERLDVENEDERRQRIEILLERTNNRDSLKNVPGSGSSLVFPMSVDHEGPHPVDPPSELLQRVRHFLPQLADSNALLARQAPDAIDIENVGKDQEQYIEMNLGLGVFEYRRKRSNPKNSSSSRSSDSDSESENNSTSSGESTSADSESSVEILGVAPAYRPMKSMPRRKRPEVVVLGESTAPARSGFDKPGVVN